MRIVDVLRELHFFLNSSGCSLEVSSLGGTFRLPFIETPIYNNVPSRSLKKQYSVLKFHTKLRGKLGKLGFPGGAEMATPGSKETGLKTLSSAGSSGDGGDEVTPATPPRLSPVPAPSPSHDPTALSTSTPALQPVRQPPPSAGKDTNEGLDIEDLGERKDDEDCEVEEGELIYDEEDWKGYFCTLNISSWGNSIPHYIFRYDSVPLNKHDYLSRWQNWNQLLDGKRTYLRPRKGRLVLKNVFRCPNACPRTLGFQEELLELVRESSNDYIIKEKIKILSQHYVLFRRTRRDGSCFYRALLFSYLENLGQMQDSLAEVTRLMECVEMCREKFSHLKWDKAYFLNPEEYLSSVVSSIYKKRNYVAHLEFPRKEFYHLVSSVANGLRSDKLYERSLEEIMSLRIISFLRLLTETEIRTKEIYKSFIPEEMNVLKFCLEAVRPLDAEAFVIQMRALTGALGIPLRVEVVDNSLAGRAVEVKHLDLFPPSESGKGPLQLTESYHSSSTATKPLERGRSDDLLSSDGTPLLTLLSRRGQCDILYPQVNKLC
ncbi:uncharacterized protein LOC100843126 isoform X1 [Brachypodium distachyon]|uniref:Uncharacterized protein n=1 Tax=Brachypodium distachyon TaxID=15368 RepID=A0A2K2CG58_BRADI|nr:uncharacterized protein LOC100843126 isoform X1 [Brachypodium distachyon]PNT61013.1 hypothetical protein BRADI_5g09056v3 [Brachypodium distachyon]|eukprot:XP_010239861.2 uncharacterized protein LOC100843126 isoform X1 [Brachypodium distachyon]